jgi:hypothetical protein
MSDGAERDAISIVDFSCVFECGASTSRLFSQPALRSAPTPLRRNRMIIDDRDDINGADVVTPTRRARRGGSRTSAVNCRSARLLRRRSTGGIADTGAADGQTRARLCSTRTAVFNAGTQRERQHRLGFPSVGESQPGHRHRSESASGRRDMSTASALPPWLERTSLRNSPQVPAGPAAKVLELRIPRALERQALGKGGLASRTTGRCNQGEAMSRRTHGSQCCYENREIRHRPLRICGHFAAIEGGLYPRGAKRMPPLWAPLAT